MLLAMFAEQFPNASEPWRGYIHKLHLKFQRSGSTSQWVAEDCAHRENAMLVGQLLSKILIVRPNKRWSNLILFDSKLRLYCLHQLQQRQICLLTFAHPICNLYLPLIKVWCIVSEMTLCGKQRSAKLNVWKYLLSQQQYTAYGMYL